MNRILTAAVLTITCPTPATRPPAPQTVQTDTATRTAAPPAGPTIPDPECGPPDQNGIYWCRDCPA